jgi:hypothetical protein
MILLNAVALRLRMMIWRKAVEFRQHKSCGKGGKQKDPPLPHFAKTTRRSSPCHVISGSFPPTVFALLPKVLQARFYRQHEANNERAVLARPVGHLLQE